eukprot:gene21366-23446_t
MDMQDVDCELVYEPGKNEKDPLDFISRHPLPDTEEDTIEASVRSVVKTENAIVMEHIQEETKTDEQLQKLMKRIHMGDWEVHQHDPDIAPFFQVRSELYIVEDVVFRLNQIVIPRSLQRKVVKSAHSLGHFGMSKTKRMLREKYWFPKMNKMVEAIVGQCFECQVTTKQNCKEPVKMTVIPEKPWEVVSVDFGGPYPDCHYNLVAVDKRTRYAEVETIHSTAAKPTMKKLKKMFATHGTPKRIESDNGPPFTSKEFAEFAEKEGFDHHRVTPDHPRANGAAESFMKILNKTEQIANLKGEDREVAILNMLTGYRSTPHPGTGVPPYEEMMNRKVRTKLDYQPSTSEAPILNSEVINQRDMKYKMKLKSNAEGRNTRHHSINIGDYVLLKQTKKNKWSTTFEPAFYVVYRVDGSSIAARRTIDGREVYRDASMYKLVNSVVQNLHPEEPLAKQLKPNDWREELFLKIPAGENLPQPPARGTCSIGIGSRRETC